MLKAFANGIPSFPVTIRFKDQKGVQEVGVDNGGLLRDALTGFWNEFFDNVSIGEDERIPQLHPDLQQSEWKAVGAILYIGLKQLDYFPTKLARSFFECYVLGEDSLTGDTLISSFLNFVSNDERILIRKALDVFSEVDYDDILDILDRFTCKRIPSAGNFREVIIDIAHREMIQSAQYVIECWAEFRPLFYSLPKINNKKAIFQLYESLKPTNKKVLNLLSPPTSPLTNSERESYCFLQRFVRGLSDEMLQNFLRFTTGSNLICIDKIRLIFTTTHGLGRRPVGHTCGATLEVPTTYSNYAEFRGEWSNILKRGDWSIDYV